MPGRTPRAALEELLEPLRSVFRCVTEDGLLALGSSSGKPGELKFQRRVTALRRRSNLSPVCFRVSVEYVIDPFTERPGSWEARITGWIYEIRHDSDADILAFHWHPRSGRVTWPHLHAYGTSEFVDLRKLHAPTGIVTASSVVQFLIEDLQVQPRRADWPAVLERHAAV